MESPNIAHIPLNQLGAVEMGLLPCNYCNMGFGSYCWDNVKKEAMIASCRDNCEILKLYNSRSSKKVEGGASSFKTTPSASDGGFIETPNNIKDSAG